MFPLKLAKRRSRSPPFWGVMNYLLFSIFKIRGVSHIAPLRRSVGVKFVKNFKSYYGALFFKICKNITVRPRFLGDKNYY